MESRLIQQTREHFSAGHLRCIGAARAGEFRVNDLPKYCADQVARSLAALRGDYDHTFTFRQYVHYLQTGAYVPLLP